MIQVTVGNNTNRERVIVSRTSTLREVLENAGIDYTRGGITLDGSTLQAGDIDKTFDDFGLEDRCFLLSVVKADNA